jgi:VLRF1 release factor-like protein
MAEAAPGARWIEVSPERIAGWVESFAERHGRTAAEPRAGLVALRAQDGSVAECHPPFPPLPRPGEEPAGPNDWARLMAAHAAADRTVGVLLVRLGGYAAGVFTGAPPRLAASKTGSRLVHGRSAAGGQSQQRFARRREKQAANALDAAADTALRVLGPYAGRLDAVVLGGDKRAISTVRADARLRPLLTHVQERFLTVPDPRLAVLKDTPRLFRAIRIRLTDPAPGQAGQPPAGRAETPAG